MDKNFNNGKVSGSLIILIFGFILLVVASVTKHPLNLLLGILSFFFLLLGIVFLLAGIRDQRLRKTMIVKREKISLLLLLNRFSWLFQAVFLCTELEKKFQFCTTKIIRKAPKLTLFSSYGLLRFS
jgi:hypothetical protein